MSTTRTWSAEYWSTTAAEVMKKVDSNQFRPNPLGREMLDKAEGVDGGISVEITFDDGEHSNTKQVTTGFEPADTSFSDILFNGSDNWGFYLRAVAVSWVDEAINAGKNKRLDLGMQRVENTRLALEQEMERRFLRERAIAQMSDLNTLNGDDEVGGFIENTAVGSQNETVHGISKLTYAANPGMQNVRYDAAGDASANLLPGLFHLTNRCFQRSRSPQDLRGYMSFPAAEHYQTLVQGFERYTVGGHKDAIGGSQGAKTSFLIGGIPTTQVPNMPDSGSTTGAGNDEWSVLVVDHKQIKLKILGGGKLNGPKSMTPFREFGAAHQGRIAFFRFGGQLCIQDWGSSGILFGADTY